MYFSGRFRAKALSLDVVCVRRADRSAFLPWEGVDTYGSGGGNTPAFVYTNSFQCSWGGGAKKDSFLFLITEALQSSKRSSLVETNKNRSAAAAKGPAPRRVQVERGDQSPRRRQQDSKVPPKLPAKRDTCLPPPAPQVAAPLINGIEVE